MYNRQKKLKMERGNIKKKIIIFLEDIWEEIEIQLFGIVGAIFFFLLVYFIYHPLWMKSLVDILLSIKIPH